MNPNIRPYMIVLTTLLVFNGLGLFHSDSLTSFNTNLRTEELKQTTSNMVIKDQIVNVTDINNITLIGRYVEGSNCISETASYGNHLIVADIYDSIKVLEVSDPTKPRKVFHDWPGGKWNGIEIVDNRLYVAHHGDGLQIYDISDPTNLLKYGILWLNEDPPYTNPQDVAVQGSYAYLADDFRGLQVINVSDISGPEGVGRWNDGGNAKGVVVNDSYAYVIETSGEFEIIDISDPLNPVEISSISDGGRGENIAIKEDIVFVADSVDGLEFYNVSDPYNPSLINKYREGMGEANALSLNGSVAYLADGNDGLEVLDISNLSSPVRTFKVNTTQYTTNVHINGSRIYVCQDEGTIDILEINSNKDSYLPTFDVINKRLKLSPIQISSNNDFENFWFPGNGTRENPYIIEQLHIRNNRTTIISITNTDIWFILRNSIFDGININFGGMGIILDNVKNGYIVNNTIKGCSQGIVIVNSENIIVSGNRFINNGAQGIFLVDTINSLIGDNILIAQSYNSSSSSSDYGMEVHNSQENTFIYNTIQKFRLYGVSVSSLSTNNQFLYNNFVDNHEGLSSQAYDTSSDNNNFSYNYWKDFTTPDDNEDGIVDLPYLIDGDNNSDPFPQTTPINHILTTPNPFLAIFQGSQVSETLTIHWSQSVDSHNTEVTYSVYYSKEQIFWKPIELKTSELSVELNTNQLADGTYHLRVIAQSATGLISYGMLDKTILVSNSGVNRGSTTQSVTSSFVPTGTITSTDISRTTNYPLTIVTLLGIIFTLYSKKDRRN